MPYTVWVGGFSGLVQEKDLTEEFSKHGETILHVKIFRDEETHKSRYISITTIDLASLGIYLLQ